MLASEASRGRILCFGRWKADFGNPIDWHRDPTNGHRWQADSHWSKALRQVAKSPGEIKFAWEAARFPQAYFFARAAALDQDAPPLTWRKPSTRQVGDFIERNPFATGLHWFSGQEIALRMMAWMFGFHVFSALGLPGLRFW